MRARLNLSLKPIRRMIESSSNLFRLFFTDNYFSIFIYKKEFLCLLFFFLLLFLKKRNLTVVVNDYLIRCLITFPPFDFRVRFFFYTDFDVFFSPYCCS
jgi:hypothetical protein